MDLSKLPRLSKTGNSTPPAEAPGNAPPQTPVPLAVGPTIVPCPQCQSPLRAGARFCDSCGMPVRSASDPDVGAGAEAWISVALGVILLFVFPNFIKYLMHPNNTAGLDALDLQTGATIPYGSSALIWPDLGVTLFAVVLVVEGLLMLLARKKPLMVACLILSAGTAAFNVWVIARSFSVIGFQIVCALAVAFCVYISLYQWKVLESLRTPRP